MLRCPSRTAELRRAEVGKLKARRNDLVLRLRLIDGAYGRLHLHHAFSVEALRREVQRPRQWGQQADGGATVETCGRGPNVQAGNVLGTTLMRKIAWRGTVWVRMSVARWRRKDMLRRLVRRDQAPQTELVNMSAKGQRCTQSMKKLQMEFGEAFKMSQVPPTSR